MKTKKILLVLTLILTTLSNLKAQDATVKETKIWLNSYGNELVSGFSQPGVDKDKISVIFTELSIKRNRNIIFSDGSMFFYEEAGLLIIITKIRLNKLAEGYYEIDLLSASNEKFSAKSGSGKDRYKAMKEMRDDSGDTSGISLYFKGKKKLMRYYKALSHYLKLKNIKYELEDNIVDENKF